MQVGGSVAERFELDGSNAGVVEVARAVSKVLELGRAEPGDARDSGGHRQLKEEKEERVATGFG